MDILDPIIFYYILTFGISLTIIVLGEMLLGLHVAPDKRLNNLRFTRNCLAVSYFILGISGFVGFFSQQEAEDELLLASSTLVIASYQALLFTYTILALIQPLYLRRKQIIIQLTAITTTAVLLFFALFSAPKTISSSFFYVVLLAYFFQIIFYTYIFRKQYRKCLNSLEAYYDDDEHIRLRWAKVSFYGALLIGILALISLFFNLYFHVLFSVSYTAFYAYMVSRIYNYQIDFGFAIPVITANLPTESEVHPDAAQCNTQASDEKCEEFKSVLDRWIEEKRYTEKDVSVDEIAASLAVSRNFFQYYFRTHMQTDFRSWRSELRIREAQLILNEDPEISLEKVREEVGFNHRANFHQQFQKITGLTPTEYRLRQSTQS